MNHFFSPSARSVSAVTASVLAACCLTACSGNGGEAPAAIRVNQVANLAMSRTGRGDILRGAVVNGPNDADLLKEQDAFEGSRPCSFAPEGGPWSRYDGHGAGYVDDVRAWQTVEPADDFTSTALYALSLTAARS
ncbi:hypothetical protein [Streptomyces sp. NPDC127039]|uniref:hypothetical protein n=1 Tax=Streptomyces sp. NPDC127039 TaxID=3347115 RepID=UPI00365ABF4E